MDVLFLHGNYPGQFPHLAAGMARQPGNRVLFLTNRHDPESYPLEGVEVRRFDRHREITSGIHPYLRSTEQGVLNGQAVIRALAGLRNEGFRPRLVIAHGGSGLLLFLRKLLPDACLVGYFEWWFRDEQGVWLFGEDSLDKRMQMSFSNGITLQELEVCDLAVTPTQWQRQQFPPTQQTKLKVVFDGVDTQMFRPASWTGTVQLNGDGCDQPLKLEADQRVLSYATRGMEPLRGFPEFMRMLPALMRQFPDLHVVVAGQDWVAYSYRAPSHGGSWKQHMLAELDGHLDLARLHFTGLLNYGDYVKLLQRSDLHAVFSRPYVTSWGLFQAAACGARLLLNRDPSIQHVVGEQQAVWGDLDDLDQLQAVAADAMALAMEQRDVPRHSALAPSLDLRVCLHRWQVLINQALKQTQAASGS